MRAKDVLGRYGEDLAVAHLAASGLLVVERNWRCAAGEIDIVARDGPVLVFCEVKTRSGTMYGGPAEAVTPAKARRLRGLAARWLVEHRPTAAADCRFDVVSIVRRAGCAPQVEHLVGAF